MASLAVVGFVVRAHGIRGALLVKPASDGSDVLLGLSALTVRRAGVDVRRKVLEAAPQGSLLRLRLEGVGDRNAAEALARAELLCSAAELPAAAAGEFYRHELVGLDVVSKADGRSRGKVVELESSPLQEWLVVSDGSSQVLVPFTEGLVEVDLPGRRVVVDAPEGLFDGEAVG